jgi:hypothetical protein
LALNLEQMSNKAIHIKEDNKFGEIVFPDCIFCSHSCAIAQISLYGRFGNGRFECWIV